jgi:hypothetical protein
LSDDDVRKVKDAVRAACTGQQPAGATNSAPAKEGCCG